MGQKVNPHDFRVGVIRDWDSRWFTEGDSADNLVEDYNIRKFLKKRLYTSDVSDIEIERASDRVRVIIHTAKPGMVIGRQGAEIEKLKKGVTRLTEKEVFIDIREIKGPDREVQLVTENIIQQLENRASFHRAMKSVMQRSMESGILGIRTYCAGHLGDADIARSESYSKDTILLQTLRADIDCSFTETDATYDKVGVKVWIYKGEVLPARAETKEGSAK